jgi:hypothetical protein
MDKIYDQLSALPYPSQAESMRNYYFLGILSLMQMDLALAMGDLYSSNFYLQQAIDYYREYLTARSEYLASIGLTLEQAGFTR